MYDNASDAYLENRVLSADPIELVRLLYQACIGAVQDARRRLAAGEVAARSRSISKACAILIELTGALDREKGGEIAERLGAIYDYLRRKLTEANLYQQDAPLVEVLALLSTLSEGWQAVEQSARTAHAPEQWTQPFAWQGGAPLSAGQSWSL